MQFCYHLNFGFGIIFDDSSSEAIYDVYFKISGLKRMVKSFITIIPKQIIDSLVSFDIKKNFTPEEEELAANAYPLFARYSNLQFEITFDGHTKVIIYDDIEKNKLINANRYMLLASYLYLKRLLRSTVIDKIGTKHLLYNIINQGSESNLPFNILLGLKYLAKSHDYTFLIELLSSVINYKKILNEVVFALVFSELTNKLISSPYLKNKLCGRLSEINILINTNKKKLIRIQEQNVSSNLVQYYFYNQEYLEALEIYFDCPNVSTSVINIANCIINKKLIEPSLLPSVLKNATVFTEPQQHLLLEIFNLLSEDEKHALVENNGYQGPLPDDFIIFSNKNLVLKKVFASDEKAIDYFTNNYNKYTEEEIKTAVTNALVGAITSRNKYAKLKILSRYFGRLPNTKYLLALFEVLCNSQYYDYIPEDKNGVSLEKKEFNDEIVDEAAFFSYFHIKLIGFVMPPDLYQIEYYIAVKNGPIVCKITEDRTGKQTPCFNYLPLVFYSYLTKCVRDTFKDQYNTLKKELDEQQKENERAVEKQKITALLKQFKIENEEIILRDDLKARLELNFNIDHNQYRLWFRFGQNYLYVINDHYAFFTSFKKKELVNYGKKFSFKHEIENIMPPYKEIILYLAPYIEGLSAKPRFSITLNQEIVANLFNLAQGEEIIYNGKKYLLRKTEVTVRPQINKDYVLTLKLNAEEALLKLGDKLYLVNDLEKTISLVKGTKAELAVINFFNEARGLSIFTNIASFCLEVLPKAANLIDIDASIKNDFMIKKLKIEAYFDYENKHIIKREKLIRGENEINGNDLSNLEELQYQKYIDYMSSLGFENNMLDNDRSLSFLAMDFSSLRELCDVYLSQSIKDIMFSRFNPPSIIINANAGIIDCFLAKTNYTDEELSTIYKALKKNKKYVLLKSNVLLDLNSVEANDWQILTSDLKLNTEELTKHKTIPIYEVLAAYAHEKNLVLDNYLQNMLLELNNFKSLEIELPQLNATLRPYQKEAYNWLSVLTKYRMGGILADDMGLGKTIEMISLITANDTLAPSIIVTPKSLIFNWIIEFKMFSHNTVVKKIYGLNEERHKIIKNIKPDEKIIYLTSYDSLRNDIGLYQDIKFKFAILDEAQYIKNVYTSKSKAVKNLNSEIRFALTGTPIENNIMDLWSIFDFIMPDFFPSFNEFKHRYITDNSYQDLIIKKIGPFILRRTKQNVLNDLPSKYVTILEATMTKEQEMLYEAVRNEAKKAMNNATKSFDLFPYLTKLRQICVDPRLVSQNYPAKSGKMLLLEELIMDKINNGHKLLIFSQFVQGLKLIMDFLRLNNLKYYLITGDTSASLRLDYANKFNASDDVKIFLVSLKAGGTGLNLIGADTVIHLDPWWNQAAMDQATDRAYRIGQTRNVEVIKLICQNSIEERVIELQNLKRDLFDKVISSDDNRIENAKLEDIAFILK